MITVFCDASFYPKTHQAGWAAWIKVGPRRGEIFGGAFKAALKSSREAELCAIANALAIAAKIDPPDVVMLQSDCLDALNLIADRAPTASVADHKHGAKIKPHSYKMRDVDRAAIASIISSVGERKLYLRHVRAHCSGSGRQWVNNACDRVAKRWAQSAPPQQ